VGEHHRTSNGTHPETTVNASSKVHGQSLGATSRRPSVDMLSPQGVHGGHPELDHLLECVDRVLGFPLSISFVFTQQKSFVVLRS